MVEVQVTPAFIVVETKLAFELSVVEFYHAAQLGSTGDRSYLLDIETRLVELSEDLCLHKLWDLDPVDLQADSEGEEQEAPRQPQDCAAYLRHLDPALGCFHPLVLGSEDDWPLVGTYSALAAQIFDRVVSREGFKHCEEETCTRPFIRYVSRTARSRSNPAKARFCSQRCSDRFFNREFRQRKRAQNLQARGLSERRRRTWCAPPEAKRPLVSFLSLQQPRADVRGLGWRLPLTGFGSPYLHHESEERPIPLPSVAEPSPEAR